MANRDPKTGRWVKGNPGGPGRPTKMSESLYLAALHRAITDGDWQLASDKMVKLAQGGDVQAYRVLAPHLMGLPVQKLQLSSSDSDKLAKVLRVLEEKGLSASEVFDGMIAELMMQEAEDADDE